MARKKKPATSLSVTTGLSTALEQIQKEFGDGSVMMFGDKPKSDINAISTGSIGLDIALGIGGIPRGRIIEIYGPEASGKTTLCQHIVASAQKSGGVCGFIDVEHALDPVYASKIGVDIDNLIISQPDCGEDALNIAEALIRSGELAVLVVDSVAALVPRAELEGQMGQSHVGLQARLMSQALRKLTGIVQGTNTTLIFTNQIREKIGVMFGSPETTSGGRALKFYASVRMDIRGTTQIKDKEGNSTGKETKVKIVKNKVAPPFRVAEFQINYGEGICAESSLIEAAFNYHVLEKAGAWIKYNGESVAQGALQMINVLKDDPELFDKIMEEVKVESGLKDGVKREDREEVVAGDPLD